MQEESSSLIEQKEAGLQDTEKDKLLNDKADSEKSGKKEIKAKKASKKKEIKIPTVSAVIQNISEENTAVEKKVSRNAGGKGKKSEEKNVKETDESEVTEFPGDIETEDVEENVEKSVEKTVEKSIEKNSSFIENLDNETALVETVLFLESEPQNTQSLSKITQLSEDVVNEVLLRLREKYASADSGIEIAEIIGGWMLVPKKEIFELVKEKYGKKNEGRLSKAAIETLSIIAYSQPITRAEIESIRHVNADNMMRILIDRHFIKEVGKKDIPGKPVLYGTTKEFLEFFHLQSISDLPQLDEKESERFELAR